MHNPNFTENIKHLLKEDYESFESSLNLEPPVSIRINPKKKITNPEKKIPWCETGYYLPERPFFTFDPLFHAGVYYVQEASSMFLEQALLTILAKPDFPKSQIITLDLCAAPGGKSTHLLTLLPEDSLLVSNEVIRSRCTVLAENLTKWGRANTVITQNDPKDFGRIPQFFDIILADLPCSGEGLFRKDPSARDKWSIDQVKHCASRQRRIIRDVWESLKPGGYLIYSTCTFNTEENEENIRTLSDELGADIIPIPVKPEWNISGALCYNLSVYRFFPHRIRGEGFFLALLQKKCQDNRYLRQDIKKTKLPAILPANLKKILSNPEKFFFKNSGNIFAFPVNFEMEITKLLKFLNIFSAGLKLGELKGMDFVPSIALALSTELNINSYPAIELTGEQAIIYLKRGAIDIPANSPKGYLLVNFKNNPLGFIKNIGTRANNLYPPEWRIVTTASCRCTSV